MSNYQVSKKVSDRMFLLLVLPVIYVVGAGYQARKVANATKSLFIMLAAAPLLVFTFVTLVTDPDTSGAWDEGGLGFCCLNLWLIPSWALVVIGIEAAIQDILSARKQQW